MYRWFVRFVVFKYRFVTLFSFTVYKGQVYDSKGSLQDVAIKGIVFTDSICCMKRVYFSNYTSYFPPS